MRNTLISDVRRVGFLVGKRGIANGILAAAAAAVTVAPWIPTTGHAALASPNYRIEPTAVSGGAGSSTSAKYSAFSGIASFVAGTATASSYSAQYGFFPAATPQDVTGRHVFYNQSAWDGNSAAANANDDSAIATDKTALLPGGSASLANYTSYSRGLNGVMVDLPNGAAPTASDFVFKRGNSGTPGTWGAAPNPSSISVRRGAGVGGGDRVTLIWANNQIQKQWLEVKVLATSRTGLASPDTFYFGNSIGETGLGNSASRFSVTSVDVLFAINNPVATGALITNVADHNRDKRVTSVDALLAINNSAVGSAALIRLNLGAGDPATGGNPTGLALASLDPQDSTPAGFMGRPEFEDGRERLWYFQPVGSGTILEHCTDLAEGRWEPVPGDWVVPYGGGFYQVSLPTDASQRFVRWRTDASGATE